MKEKLSLSHQKLRLLSVLGLPKMLLTMDMFSKPLTKFNIKGQSDLRTLCGSCLSILVITTAIAFDLVKLEHLRKKHNPTVNIFKKEDAFDDKEITRADEYKDFMMAFAITNAFNHTDEKDDPTYVKWLAFKHNNKNGNWSVTGIPMQKC